ncbi:MAG: phage baseplate assembly protein V [Firmicutes bacterium]|nr:phage baseplate assembly protein V [Bacillota bacterium]
MANHTELAKVLKGVFLQLFPELRGYHFPIRAKVVKVYEGAGRMDPFNHRYSVDVQPLSPDGSVNKKAPVIPDVEIPVLWAGPARGVYCLPVVGAIVRVAFYYNDPAQPFVDAILGEGFDSPAHPLGSFIVQHSDGTRIEIDAHKNIYLLTPAIIEMNAGAEAKVTVPKVTLAGGGHPVAFADVVKQIFDSHVHPTSTGNSGPPTSPMSGHDSQKVFTG